MDILCLMNGRFYLDNIALEYRDPLFGIILIVALVFVISLFTYYYSIYKERNARKDYRKLSLRFELGKLKEEDYVHLYKTYNLPFDSILLLASSFLHKGDYNKAISVYLTLLEHVNDRVKKEELLELLGISRHFNFCHDTVLPLHAALDIMTNQVFHRLGEFSSGVTVVQVIQ